MAATEATVQCRPSHLMGDDTGIRIVISRRAYKMHFYVVYVVGAFRSNTTTNSNCTRMILKGWIVFDQLPHLNKVYLCNI